MISRCVNVTCNDKNDQIGIVIENDIFLTNICYFVYCSLKLMLSLERLREQLFCP